MALPQDNQHELRKKVLRIVVPLVVIAAGVGIFFAVARNTTHQRQLRQARQHAAAPLAADAAPPPAQVPPSEPASAGPPAAASEQPQPAPEQAASTQQQPQAAPATFATLFPGVWKNADGTPVADPLTPIGGLEPAGQWAMQVSFSRLGAGIERIALAPYFETIAQTEHVTIQEPVAAGAVMPMGAEAVWINGTRVAIVANAEGPVWRETAPGSFEAFILSTSPEGGAVQRIARITRTYELSPRSFTVRLVQKLENLTDAPMRVVWQQNGPGELRTGVIRYGGDIRRVRFGYLVDPASDPSRQFVDSDRRQIVAHAQLAKEEGDAPRALWPNERSQREKQSLVWFGMSNRYFAAALHPLLDAASANDKAFALAGHVESLGYGVAQVRREFVLRLTSPELTVAPGALLDLSMGLYAGPMSARALGAEPLAGKLGLTKLVIYTFGGPCAFCTFQFITYFLAWFLGLLHDHVVFDWALAIMVLVVCVRTVLHPLTRWSQIRLATFGKQMQAVAPKQKKLQEKFAGDPRKLREEMAKLMREENISYAGMLGCLPMFLQMPVWIALYAMLFFNFELRHQSAFFGVFQWLSSSLGVSWRFMADLAEPDHFIPFGASFRIPFISDMMGPIDAINILPLIMGVVFYIQQKYLAPPSTSAMTPEMEQQQKMMRVISVVLFPLFMYNAPAGLSVYFLTNSTLGILESRHIRKQVEKMDLTARPSRARPGFMERLRQRVEARQAMLEQSRRAQQRRK